MLRSAQMMLAHAWRKHSYDFYCGNSSTTTRIPYHSKFWNPHNTTQQMFLHQLLGYFLDAPPHVYSLPNMVAAGYRYDQLPGEWYGPSTVSYVVRDLVERHAYHIQNNKKEDDTSDDTKKDDPHTLSPPPPLFRVYVAPNGTIYQDAVQQLMTKGSSKPHEEELLLRQHASSSSKPKEHPLENNDDPDDSSFVQIEPHSSASSSSLPWDTSLLLLIPVRLGLHQFAYETYAQALFESFQWKQSVGVLGGRPRGARWFTGATTTTTTTTHPSSTTTRSTITIRGLDPHTVQPAAPMKMGRMELTRAFVESCENHDTSNSVFSMKKLDPSMALCFYCRNQEEYENLLLQETCLFSVQAKENEYYGMDEEDDSFWLEASNGAAVTISNSNSGSTPRGTRKEEDEFVLL